MKYLNHRHIPRRPHYITRFRKRDLEQQIEHDIMFQVVLLLICAAKMIYLQTTIQTGLLPPFQTRHKLTILIRHGHRLLMSLRGTWFQKMMPTANATLSDSKLRQIKTTHHIYVSVLFRSRITDCVNVHQIRQLQGLHPVLILVEIKVTTLSAHHKLCQTRTTTHELLLIQVCRAETFH